MNNVGLPKVGGSWLPDQRMCLVDGDVIHVMKCSQDRSGGMRVDLHVHVAIQNRTSSTVAVLYPMTLSLSL